MKKSVLVISIFIALFLVVSIIANLEGDTVSLSNVDSNIKNEMQKITHYAEEYETGNINYIKLMLYIGSTRDKLNNLLGVSSKEMGGILKQGQIKSILGEPNEFSKWAWDERENHDVKLDEKVPQWKKIVFDGKKIQIRLNAFPMMHKGEIVYSLYFETEFKKPEEQLDISSKVEEIKGLAEKFNADSSNLNAEALAKASVNVEKTFESYFRQTGGDCESIMASIFGSENKRETQKIIVQEINFYEGEDFEAIMRLEMCDECEWNYVNLDFWIDSRGKGFKMPKENEQRNQGQYKGMSSSEFKSEVKKIIEEIQGALEQGDYGRAMSYKNKLWMVNEAWNKIDNDLWKTIDKEFEPLRKNIEEEHRKCTESNSESCDDKAKWDDLEIKKRLMEVEIRKKNFEDKKQFYLDLFSAYEKDEYYFEEERFEKRLIEEFREKGREICDNNIDDNENEFVDCLDEQCAGKICRSGEVEVVNGNVSSMEVKDFYCINKICQQREEIEKKGPVCGNHICEEGEMVFGNMSEDSSEDNNNCIGDCTECFVHPSVECIGKVIFSGEDENGCPLPPICISGEEFCKTDEDCPEPLCGKAECVYEKEADEVGVCQTAELEKCREEECIDGEEKIVDCFNDQMLVVAVCVNSKWKKTGLKCEGDLDCVKCGDGCITKEESMVAMCPFSTTQNFNCKTENGQCVKIEKKIVGIECVVRADCGGEEDVCSNGKCVRIPSKVVPDSECNSGSDCDDNIDCSDDFCVDGKCGHVDKCEDRMGEESPLTSHPSLDNEEEEQGEQQESQQEEQEQQQSEPETATNPDSEITGNVIFRFFAGLINRLMNPIITGRVVDEGISGSVDESSPTDSSPADEGPSEDDSSDDSPLNDDGSNDNKGDDVGDDYEPGPGPEPDNDCADKWKACGGSCPPCDYDEGPDGGEGGDEEYWNEKDRQDKKMYGDKGENKEDKERRINECKGKCENDCVQTNINKCSGDCFWKSKCDDEECMIKAKKDCEDKCKNDKSNEIDDCKNNCFNKCENEDWEQFNEMWQEQEFKEEKGVFTMGGQCRKNQQKTEGFIWFGGWGEPFEELEPLKHKYYSGGEGEWCKWDLENLKRQREEMEKGFNQEFAIWFFEKYLSNSAGEFESHISGLFELYWRNVDIQREMAYRMKCMGMNDINNIMDYNLINIKYDTEYGSLEYWEEVKEVDIDGEKITIISPYMKTWIFPNKEFMKYEFKTSMENHKFPGPEGDKGMSEEQRNSLKEDNKFMKELREVISKYGESMDVIVQFKDYDTGEIVFNAYVNVNEKDVFDEAPQKPEDNPESDIQIEADFNKLYDMIYISEKDMMGIETQSPPWDKERLNPIKTVKKITNGAKMYLKERALMNSVKVSPKSAESDGEYIFREIMSTMGGGEPDEKMKKEMEKEGEQEGGGGKGEGDERSEKKGKEPWNDKKTITGEVISFMGE